MKYFKVGDIVNGYRIIKNGYPSNAYYLLNEKYNFLWGDGGTPDIFYPKKIEMITAEEIKAITGWSIATIEAELAEQATESAKRKRDGLSDICFNLVYNTIEYCTGEDTANAHIDWCELKSKEATAEIMKLMESRETSIAPEREMKDEK